MHHKVEDGIPLEPKEREALTDYTRALIAANNQLAKQGNTDSQEDYSISEEEMRTMIKQAQDFYAKKFQEDK